MRTLQICLDQPAVADLVRAAAEGDSEAWDQLVERYRALVWSIPARYGLCPADAADVSQTTWLRLFENLDSLHTPERVGAWLAVTARHETLRVLRRAGRQIPVGEQDELEAAPSETPEVDLRLLTAERNAELWQAVGQLSSRCQRLLRTLMADPAPRYADVAAALQMPIGSIGPTRRRCLDCLRRQLEEQSATPLELLAAAG